MKAALFIISIWITTSWGCSILSTDPWDELDPCSDQHANELDKLSLQFESEEIRSDAIQKIQYALKSIYLSPAESLRLAVYSQVLINQMESPDERKEFFNVLKCTRRHGNFTGNMVAGRFGMAPYYIVHSLNIFLDDSAFSAYLFNPDGCRMVKVRIGKYFVYNLSQATGKNFGDDFKRWRDWWETEGQYLDYDWKKNKYIYPAEDNKDTEFSEESKTSDKLDSELDKKDNPPQKSKKEKGKLIELGYM